LTHSGRRQIAAEYVPVEARKFFKTARRYRTIQIQARPHRR